MLPKDAVKFEGVKGWWSGHNVLNTKQFGVNVKSGVEILFNYNQLDLYIQADRLLIAGKAHIHFMWGSKWWLKPVVIYREQPKSSSEYEFTCHFISAELRGDDLRITFWNYAYKKQMVLHIKSQQSEIQAAIAADFHSLTAKTPGR